MKGAFNEEDNQIIKLRKWANNIFNLVANLAFRKKVHMLRIQLMDIEL